MEFNSESLLGDFFEKAYRVRRLRGKSPNTLRLYRRSIDQLSKAVERRATLGDLDEPGMLLLMQVLTDRGLAVASRNKELCQLNAIHRLANRIGAVKTWPILSEEPVVRQTPLAWQRDDLIKIFASIKRCVGSYEGVPRYLWFECLTRLLLETGERIGAVEAAEWSWLEGGYLKVPGEHRKGRKSDAMYKLSDGLIALLKTMRELSRQNKIFFRREFRTTLWSSYGLILRRAGLPHGSKDKFHRFRRTVASVLDSKGHNATKALDHSRAEVTKRSYLDPRFDTSMPTSQIMAEWMSGILDASRAQVEALCEPQEAYIDDTSESKHYVADAFRKFGVEATSYLVRRWVTVGTSGVKLQATKDGQRYVTTLSEVKKFLSAVPVQSRYRISNQSSKLQVADGLALCDW